MSRREGRGGGRDHLLEVDPDAVPGLRKAFGAALAEVDEQIAAARAELRVSGWAKDPVSEHATAVVNDRSVDADGTSALEALVAFRDRLGTAAHNLGKTAEQYSLLEDDNRATVTHKGHGGQG